MLSGRMLSEKEVARLLSVSVGLLRKMRSKKTGPPFIKIETLVRYDREVLENWVATNMKKENQVTNKVDTGLPEMSPKVVEQYILNENGVPELNPEYYATGLHLVS